MPSPARCSSPSSSRADRPHPLHAPRLHPRHDSDTPTITCPIAQEKHGTHTDGRVVAVTGSARGIGLRDGGAAARRGRPRRHRRHRSRPRWHEAAAALGARRPRPRAGRDRPGVVRGVARGRRGRASDSVDVLVNNAGMMPIGPLVDEPDDAHAQAVRRQRPRGDHRHEAGAGADARAWGGPGRQRRVDGRVWCRPLAW